jgi:hypothetical protein
MRVWEVWCLHRELNIIIIVTMMMMMMMLLLFIIAIFCFLSFYFSQHVPTRPPIYSRNMSWYLLKVHSRFNYFAVDMDVCGVCTNFVTISEDWNVENEFDDFLTVTIILCSAELPIVDTSSMIYLHISTIRYNNMMYNSGSNGGCGE